ncbi:DNA ligase 1-like [Cochliomyia hominivorax]
MSQRNIRSYFKPKEPKEESPNLNDVPKKPIKKDLDANPNVATLKRNAEEVLNNNSKLFKIEQNKDTNNKQFGKTEKRSPGKILSLNVNNNDTAAMDFNPSKLNYDPLKDVFWTKNQSTPYLALARTFQLIEETKGRLKMVEILGNFFCSVILQNPEDLLPSIYLSINQLAPAYEGLELGVAEYTLMKIICDSTGRKIDFIKSQTHLTGDLGIVAEQSKMAQRMMFKPAPLTIMGVYKKLKDIAKAPGKNKVVLIKDVFVACRGPEARFFIRSLIGKLRIGIAEQSLLNALSTGIVKANNVDCIKKLHETTLKEKIEANSLILKTTYW